MLKTKTIKPMRPKSKDTYTKLQMYGTSNMLCNVARSGRLLSDSAMNSQQKEDKPLG